MSIEMSDTVDPVFVGGKTTYSIIIKNVGSAPVTNVRMAAFVPDGLKFDKSDRIPKNRTPVVGGEWIEFAVWPEIDVGLKARYEITVDAVGQGWKRFMVEIIADQLDPGRPVIETESTTVVDDRERKVQVKGVEPHREVVTGQGLFRDGAELPIAGVAQARDDVALLVEMAVERGEVDRHIGMLFLQHAHAFGGRDDRDEAQVADFPFL